MIIDELSDKFDVLLNSYGNPSIFGADASHTNIALDEYEKSIILTESLYDIVTSLYTGRNPTGDGFDSSEELKSNLSFLLETKEYSQSNLELPNYTIENGNYVYLITLSPDIMYVTMESADYNIDSCINKNSVTVVPIEQDEWHKIKNNPFRGVTSSRILRMEVGNNTRNIKILSKFPLSKYYINYIRTPHPIILTDLGNNLTIYGEYKKSSNIDLPEYLHGFLLTIAVQKATTYKGLNKPTTNNNEK